MLVTIDGQALALYAHRLTFAGRDLLQRFRLRRAQGVAQQV
jgi:hypothetical protein